MLPAGAPILPVGGVTLDNMAPYIVAGANGFGLGSALYRPGDNTGRVARNAAAFVAAWRAIGS